MDIQKNIEEFKKQELARLKESRRAEPENLVDNQTDLYQQTQDRIYNVNQKTYPKGSSKDVEMSAYAVIDGMGAEGLDHAFKEAKEDISALKAQGERGRAEVRRNQYMQEHFLPALEVVVNATSPDEVLNSNKVLSDLDKYALLEGSGKGYTATYIRQAYGNQLGQKEGRSDASVRSEMMRINSLLDSGEIRSAVGLANKLKKKIDNGENQADDVDYTVLGRIVAYYK